MNTLRWVFGIIVLGIVALIIYFLIYGSAAAPAFAADLSNATYTFEGDTFTLQNGSMTIQGHSGLAGTPDTTLIPIGYTLAATSSGDLQGNGTQDGVAVLYRGFGADLEYLDLFAFSDNGGTLQQIASSTIYTQDSKVESVSVGTGGIVSVNLLVVSAADQQNLPHYEQVPNQPETLQFVLSGNTFVPVQNGNTATATTTTGTATTSTDGMSEYTDPTYGFTFWYPSALSVSATAENDTTSYPGGTAVEVLQVGSLGGTKITVVNSPAMTITDEPNGHAAPIAQTKYFYDSSTGAWMVAYPEGSMTGTGGATTTANVSNSTIGGLPELPSGARFDTTIIPLSTTQFLVLQDGGGSTFTDQLAATVAPQGATIDPSVQSQALRAEAAAYAQGQ